ncbi:MAG: WGR domain-containing protein [Gammaproteobacteria bacterium]|nr:WGR domain-containing protein [Gammaproteobacteria bacterium]
MRIYMQTAMEENAPMRFCQLILQQDLLGGWTLIKERGTQGSKGRFQREHHESYADAENAMIRARDVLVNKGYRVVFIRGEAIS